VIRTGVGAVIPHRDEIRVQVVAEKVARLELARESPYHKGTPMPVYETPSGKVGTGCASSCGLASCGYQPPPPVHQRVVTPALSVEPNSNTGILHLLAGILDRRGST
jgi:hypothetical protein